MTAKNAATDTLDRDFCELRHRLIDVAAGFDRFDRAGGEAAMDPRMAQLIETARALCDGDGNRTERIQLIFSDPYDADWRNA